MKKNNTPVLQDWVLNLDWKSQTGLISAIRGLDTDDASVALTSKQITKMLRYAILHNADKKTEFMTSSAIKADDIKMMLAKLKVKASKHWYDHTIKAIELISTHNPNGYISSYWTSVLGLDHKKAYYRNEDCESGKLKSANTTHQDEELSCLESVLGELKPLVSDLKNDLTIPSLAILVFNDFLSLIANKKLSGFNITDLSLSNPQLHYGYDFSKGDLMIANVLHKLPITILIANKLSYSTPRLYIFTISHGIETLRVTYMYNDDIGWTPVMNTPISVSESYTIVKAIINNTGLVVQKKS